MLMQIMLQLFFKGIVTRSWVKILWYNIVKQKCQLWRHFLCR